MILRKKILHYNPGIPGGGENHELSGNFCPKLSEFSKIIWIGREEFKTLRMLKYCQLTVLFDKKDFCLPPHLFSAILQRNVGNFRFRDS